MVHLPSIRKSLATFSHASRQIQSKAVVQDDQWPLVIVVNNSQPAVLHSEKNIMASIPTTLPQMYCKSMLDYGVIFAGIQLADSSCFMVTLSLSGLVVEVKLSLKRALSGVMIAVKKLQACDLTLSCLQHTETT